MKTFKKALAVVMCVVMTLTAAPLNGFVGMELPDGSGFKKIVESITVAFDGFSTKAQAATYSGTCGDNLTWSLDTETGVLNITGSGAMPNYYRTEPWRSYKSYIKSVIIGDGVTAIGNNTFENYESIKSLKISNSVKEIGFLTFSDCDNLKDVYYDGTIEEWCKITHNQFSYTLDYADNFFIHDELIKDTLVIPDTINIINAYSFYGYSKITSVLIPDSVESIGDGAFSYCMNLTSITLFNSVTNIGERAFYCYLQKLTDIYYNGCSKDWTKIAIGTENDNLLNATRHYAYHYINWVDDGITTEDRVKVGDSIVVPADPEKDYYTFTGWDSEIPDIMPESDLTITAQFIPITYYADFVVDGEIVGTVPYTVETETIEEPIIPQIVGYTGAWEDYEFTPGGITVNAYYTINSHTVTWDVDGETTVDNYEFGDEIVKPADPEKEGYTFTGWDKEIASTVPDEDLVYTATWKVNSYTVKWDIDGEVTEEAYDYGEAITAPAPEKDGYFFIGWGAIVPETMHDENLEFTAQWNKNSFTYEKDENGNVTIIGAKDANGDIEIPDNINGYPVTAIADGAFAGSGISSVTIPEGVETIGEAAFAYCESLKTVNIPASVTAIDPYAFVGSTNIENINISAENESYATDEYGVIYNKDFTTLVYAPAKSVGEAYAIRSTATSAEDTAFIDCENFALTLPDNLTFADDTEFFIILSVNEFIVNESNQNFSVIDGVLYSKDGTILIKYPVDSTNQLYVIPEKVNAVSNDFAFVTTQDELLIITGYGLPYDENTFDSYYKKPAYLTVHITEITDEMTGIIYGPSHYCKTGFDKDYVKEGNAQLAEDLKEIDEIWASTEESLEPGTALYYALRSTVLGMKDLIGTYTSCDGTHARLHPEAEVEKHQDANCTEDGYSSYNCVCGYKFTDEITAPGHSYEAVVTAPTCTEKGFTTHTCYVCGDTYTDSEVPENGHNYDSVVTNPTCTTDGYTTHTCSVCGVTYTDSVIKAEGHKYENVVTAPTCTEKGYTTHTCSVCGDTYTDSEVAETGHSHEGKVTKEPTCTNTGVRTFTCHCGDSYTEVIKSNGHSKGDWEYIGGKEYAKSCTVCGEKLESKIVTVDMFFNGENVNKKQILNKSTATVTATVTDNFVNDLVFASSDSSIVSVDANGNLVANDVGKATITVTIKGTAISDSIEVEVLPRDFTITWNVNGKQSKQTVKEYAAFTPNVNTTRQGYKFIGWDKAVPSKMPSENLEFTAQYELIVKQLKIKNPSTSTINYGETLVMHADFGGVELPEGWSIQWTVEGAGFNMAPAADGLTCKMTSVANGNATVKATLVDENGEAVIDADGNEMSDSKQLTSKAGFWQKFVSFFKNLFGISRIILQSI